MGVAFAAYVRHEQKFGVITDQVRQQLNAVAVAEVAAHTENAPFEFDTAAGIHQHLAVVITFQHQYIASAQFAADIFRGVAEVGGDPDADIAARDLEPDRIDGIV